MKLPILKVQDMVEEYLASHGYDGLYSPGNCCCEAGDIAPCGQVEYDCIAGYKQPCDCGDGCDFHVGPRQVAGLSCGPEWRGGHDETGGGPSHGAGQVKRLSLDVARCAGRPNGLRPDDPVCPRRDTCLRFLHLLEMGPRTSVYTGMCFPNGEFPFYLERHV